MMIEVRHLRTLSAIADTGSLTRAAKRQNLTLSAISHQLRELEDQLGLSLLDRRNKPLRLEPAGERLLSCARSVLPALEECEADLRGLAAKGRARLHLALECHSCFDWLLPALNELRTAWPALDTDLRLGARFDPIPALLAGEVDAVLGTDRVDNASLRYETLFRYEIMLLVPNQHRLAARVSVEAEELADEPFVTYPVDLERLDVVTRFLRPAGVEPRRARTAELTPVLLHLVQSGHGVAALPSWVVADVGAQDGVRSVRLGARGLHSELFVAMRARDAQAPELRAFVSIARRVSRELLPGIEGS
ncbi:MAG TPA: LysR family transcriptional regulator [Polyangiaceae bacterium]|jgi:LysR family transcriptional regulator for metE and metH